MTWIRRQADEHHCSLPAGRQTLAGAKTGDVWECDTTGCGAQFRLTVEQDQRDGPWLRWARIKDSELPNAHHPAPLESGSIDMREARPWTGR